MYAEDVVNLQPEATGTGSGSTSAGLIVVIVVGVVAAVGLPAAFEVVWRKRTTARRGDYEEIEPIDDAPAGAGVAGAAAVNVADGGDEAAITSGHEIIDLLDRKSVV